MVRYLLGVASRNAGCDRPGRSRNAAPIGTRGPGCDGASRAERLLELQVVLVADRLVGAGLQGEDRRLEPGHELEHAARPSVEADRAGESVAPGGRGPRVAAAEAEADRDDRLAALLAQVPDAGGDVRLDPLRRRLLHVAHEIPLVGTLADAGGAAEVVEGERGVPTLGKPQGELLVEAVQPPHVGQDHDAAAGLAVGERLEGSEAV